MNTQTSISLSAGDPLPHSGAHGPELFVALHLVQHSGAGQDVWQVEGGAQKYHKEMATEARPSNGR